MPQPMMQRAESAWQFIDGCETWDPEVWCCACPGSLEDGFTFLFGRQAFTLQDAKYQPSAFPRTKGTAKCKNDVSSVDVY
eukprot:364832-Chlamydomonas_euryale.AAC.2